jgi:hypothetical protein
MISTMIHAVFGYTLMGAGVTRIIEISFVLKDKNTLVGPQGGDVDAEINSFQWMPVFLLYAGGFLFMGATEEQMKVLNDYHVTHVSYVLILYSIAFLLFLCKFAHLSIHSHFVRLIADIASCRSCSHAPQSLLQTLELVRKHSLQTSGRRGAISTHRQRQHCHAFGSPGA